MWVLLPSPTSCTASLSRRGLTSHSWWQVCGFWRETGGSDVLRRSWPPSHLTSRSVVFIGESGLGKSTLINSLFLTNLYEDRQVPDASGKICAPHPCGLPHPLLLSWSSMCPWPLPASSDCILFLSVWGLGWLLVFSETVSSSEGVGTGGAAAKLEPCPALKLK